MAENAFFNKYPYTDFHELNLDWVLGKTQDVAEAVEEMDSRVTAAEADIDTIQGSAIMDAQMLHSVSLVSQQSDNVSISFRKAAYTDGAQTTFGYDLATLPARDDMKAGVMLPGDKAKLDAFSVSGDDVTISGDLNVGGAVAVTGNAAFAGSVSVPAAPAAGSDVVNKTYADSLALTGATATEEDMIGDDGTEWSASIQNYQLNSAATESLAICYGQARELAVDLTLSVIDTTLTDSWAAGDEIASCDISDALISGWHITNRTNFYIQARAIIIAKNYHATNTTMTVVINGAGKVKVYANEAYEYAKGGSIRIFFNSGLLI